MRRRIYVLMGLFCILCFVSAAFGDTHYDSPENILKFADHLYQEGDYLRAAGEYQRYLFHSSQDADNVQYRLGMCYRRAGDTERAIASFHKLTQSSLKFAASYQIAYSYFLSGRHKNSIQFLNEAMDRTEDNDERGKLQILSTFNHLHQKRWSDAERMLGTPKIRDEELSQTALTLRANAQEGMYLPRRSPALAGLLSAVVPGAGKLYCGQYGDGIYSLFLAGVTGLLAWDGFQENGVHSVRGWIFGSAFGIFYAGNIYGSTIAARVYNHQLETDLLKRLPAVPDE